MIFITKLSERPKNLSCPNCTKFCMVLTSIIIRYSVKKSAQLDHSFQNYGKNSQFCDHIFIYSEHLKNKVFYM